MEPTEMSTADDAQLHVRPGLIIGLMVASIIVIQFVHYIPLLPFVGDVFYPSTYMSFGLMAGLPFFLARIAPKAAGFEVRWFPRKWLHWLWFVGMVVLMFVASAVAKPLANALPVKYSATLMPPGFMPSITVKTVYLHGILLILLCPIAEEIFYRGYMLEQLRKVTSTGIALLIQSLVFSCTHLPLFFPREMGYQAAIATFFWGLMLGLWRIRFRSLLPLILAHIILNGVASIHILTAQYSTAKMAAEVEVCDFGSEIRSSPKCRQIYRLTKEPSPKALPAIIAYLGDPDSVVSVYATEAINKCYKHEAEPYLKEALQSKDKQVVDGVLSFLGITSYSCLYSGLKQEVRNVAWSVNDEPSQHLAVMTLSDFRDTDGLCEIEARHPNEKTRKYAGIMLRRIEEYDRDRKE